MPTYTVQKGDTLSKIGSTQGIDWNEIYSANKGVIGGNPNLIKPGQVLNIPYKTPPGGAPPAGPAPIVPPAPTAVSGETPAGTIAGSMAPTPTAGPGANMGNFGNLRLAMRDALNEAGRKRLENNFSQVSGVASKLPPGSMGGVVELIRNGIQRDVTSTNEVIEKGIEDEQIRRKEMMNTIGMLADSGALMDMNDPALLVIEQQAGLPQGTMLAWKSRLTTASKISDEKAQLELEMIKSQIEENKAQAAKARQPSGGGGSSSGVKNEFREDAASMLQEVQSGNKTAEDAMDVLRVLYTEDEVSDAEIAAVFGVKSIGSEDLDEDDVEGASDGLMPGDLAGKGSDYYTGNFQMSGQNNFGTPMIPKQATGPNDYRLPGMDKFNDGTKPDAFDPTKGIKIDPKTGKVINI